MKKNKSLNRKLIEKQVEFIKKIQQIANVNLVDCGYCGSTFFHDTSDKEITCPYCECTSDPCDFPDAIYNGIINNLCD